MAKREPIRNQKPIGTKCRTCAHGTDMNYECDSAIRRMRRNEAGLYIVISCGDYKYADGKEVQTDCNKRAAAASIFGVVLAARFSIG